MKNYTMYTFSREMKAMRSIFKGYSYRKKVYHQFARMKIPVTHYMAINKTIQMYF